MERQTDMDYSHIQAFVNHQVAFHASKAAEYQHHAPKRAERHANTAKEFADIAAWIPTAIEAINLRDQHAQHLKDVQATSDSLMTLKEVIAPKQQQLALSFEDIEGLPEELLAELGLSDGDRLDFAIGRMVEQAGGVLSLDRLLIAIFKETGEVQKRDNLNQRIYRMTKRGDLFAVPGKKGVYSNVELTEEQASALK